MNLKIIYKSEQYELDSPSNGRLVTEYRTGETREGRYSDTITLVLRGTISQKLGIIEKLAYFSQLSLLQNIVSLPELYLSREINNITKRARVYQVNLLQPVDTLDRLLRASPQVIFEIVRDAWEGDLTALSLAKPGENPTTNWVTLENVSDTGRANYVSINVSGVTTSIPAPLELWIENISSTTPSLVLITCGGETTNPLHVLEAENASGGTQYPANPDTTLYSNGYYKELSITTTKTAKLTWTVSGSSLQGMQGLPFAIWLRPVSTVASGLYLQVSLETHGITVAETPVVITKGNEELIELGSLYIPNLSRYALSQKQPGDYSIKLWVWGSSSTLNVDYLELVPYQFGYRKILIAGSGFTTNAILVVNEIENVAYLELANQVHNPIVPFGTQLLLRPDFSTYLYFKTLSSQHVSQQIKVKAFYRGKFVL